MEKRLLKYLITTALGLSAQGSLADATFDSHYAVTASGGLADLSSNYTITTKIKDNKIATSTTDDASGKATEELIDLDSESISRSTDAEAIVEISFDERADELYGLQEAVFSSTGEPLPVTTDNCAWSSNRFSARDYDESRRIKRIKSYRHIISSQQSCQDRQSNQSCTFTWTLEAWLAGKRIDELDEAHTAFSSLGDGLDAPLWFSRFPKNAQLLIALFPDKWEAMFDRMDEFGGTPLEMDLSLEVNSANCLSELEKSSAWSEAAVVAVSAGGQAVGSAVGSSAGDAMGDSIGGQIGGSMVGAAAGSIFGGLTKPAPKKQPPASLSLFHIRATLEAWNDKVVTLPDWSVKATTDAP